MYNKTIEEIRAHYREMRFMENQRKRMDLAFQSFVRTLCGYTTHVKSPANTAALKRAQALIAGKAPDDPLVGRVEWIRGGNESACAPFIGMEREKVKEIEAAVKKLPIWTEWAEPIPGLGAKGIGIIIGEAGDVGSYRSEAALWKRMGVGVIDQIAQGKLRENAPAELWILHGYNRKRRAALFTIGDSLIKARKSPYRALYLSQKDIIRQRLEAEGFEIKPAAMIKSGEKATCFSDGHVHRRAQRWMEKKLLRHMYRNWRRLMIEDAKPIRSSVGARNEAARVAA